MPKISACIVVQIFSALPGFVIIQCFLKELVQTAGLRVRFDLLVPEISIVLLEPLSKCVEFRTG